MVCANLFRRVLPTLIVFNLLGYVCPFTLTPMHVTSRVSTLRLSAFDLKMSDDRFRNECSVYSKQRDSSSRAAFQNVGERLMRRDIVNFLVGVAVAGAGAKSSFAVCHEM